MTDPSRTERKDSGNFMEFFLRHQEAHRILESSRQGFKELSEGKGIPLSKVRKNLGLEQAPSRQGGAGWG